MVQLRQQLALELMREADVNTVQEIEREIFATPWPRNAYYRELASRASAHYVVLRQEGMVERPTGYRLADFDPSIIGYGGGGGLFHPGPRSNHRDPRGPPPPGPGPGGSARPGPGGS